LRLAIGEPNGSLIISQNGNAYEEGLSAGWNPIQKTGGTNAREIVLHCAIS